MQITEIIRDDTMQEIRPHGTKDFPFEYYYDEIKKYEKQYIDWHWHQEFEWAIVEQGPIVCRVGAQNFTLQQGDGLFINSRVIHRFESPNEGVMPNILFRPAFIAGETMAIYRENVLPVLESPCQFLVFPAQDNSTPNQQTLQALREALAVAAVEPPDRLECHIAVCRLWHTFVQQQAAAFAGGPKKDSPTQMRTRAMMQFVAEHYTEPITLQEIAASANISKSEALRCFHLTIQSTPVRYLIDYRLECASGLLRTTDDTVTQIAAAVGMDNISYFVRMFAQKFGATPRSFRQQYKEITEEKQ